MERKRSFGFRRNFTVAFLQFFENTIKLATLFSFHDPKCFLFHGLTTLIEFLLVDSLKFLIVLTTICNLQRGNFMYNHRGCTSNY